MEDNKEKLLSGEASSHVGHDEKAFGKIEMLLDATGGLSLSQVCTVTGLEGSTIQNWVKRGWVEHPNGKKYEKIHIARILIINALKECIKLEHISQLMIYVNGAAEDYASEIIKESDLYNYLQGALQRLGQVEDLSQGGVESIVETVIKDYKGPTPYARLRIRKALTLMVYACVCTNVKRRTEAMLQQVLHELENPGSITDELLASEAIDNENRKTETPIVEETVTETQVSSGYEESRKTIAQALREWDLASIESIIDEENEKNETDNGMQGIGNKDISEQSVKNEDKSTQKPWYFRRN